MENNICKKKGCQEKKVFLEDYCWSDMLTKAKSEYGSKLLEYLQQNKIIEKQNFHKVEIFGITFPDYSCFRNCTFTGANLEGISLQRADFRDSIFTNATVKDCHLEFSDFRGIDTYLDYADMRETHFDGALLQNTICTGTDFRDAIFFDADMVGAMLKDTKLFSSRFNNTRLRKESFCNFENIKERKIQIKDECFNIHNEAIPSPLESSIVYSHLKNNFKSIGSFEDERWAYKKERISERKRLFKFSFSGERKYDKIALERWKEEDKNKIFESRPKSFIKWLWLNIERFFGYGTSAKPLLIISTAIIVLCSFLYLQFGFEYSVYTSPNDYKTPVLKVYQNFKCVSDSVQQPFLSCYADGIYFSVVTFTTLGYGDAHPLGISKAIASIEALSGLILMALAVSILAKNIFRN